MCRQNNKFEGVHCVKHYCKICLFQERKFIQEKKNRKKIQKIQKKKFCV